MKESSSKENSFMVVLLGIVFDTEKRKILIIRREKDEYIKNLTWAFPGGKLEPNEKIEDSLKREVKEETGYNVEILGSVFSRVSPEKKDLVLIYYLCEVLSGKERASDDAKELKWVQPEELRGYFTTSFEPALEEYINNLK